MYEFHGWVSISDSTYEDGDNLHEIVDEIKLYAEKQNWNNGSINFNITNGAYFLSVNGLSNHKGQEAQEVEDLFNYIARSANGSYGLLYTRDDEDSYNSFKVFVLSRGNLKEQKDTFLSPCSPVIED